MPTELWLRNPKNYAREVAEVGHNLIAWDRGMLMKFSMDPVQHANLSFGDRWQILMIGAQGTMHLDPTHGMLNPLGVYPTWCYGDPVSLLEEMVEKPAGENQQDCFDVRIRTDERPVWGQEHRVVIAEGPPGGAGSSTGMKFYRFLKELQEDYPHCKIYLHNSYSYRIMFGLGLHAADMDPRLPAQKGKVILPSGKVVPYEQVQKNPKWLTVGGYSIKEIEVPRNRCMFNIKSGLWAAQHYTELFNFRITRNGTPADSVTPEIEHKQNGTTRFLTSNKRPLPGDRISCDSCSLANNCKYEREGAVCSVPGSEGSELAKYFKTRDSGMIMDGLSEILALQTRRAERGMQEEEFGDEGGLDPEVTKILKNVFDQGERLAKLVDPSLRSGPKVAVNVSGGGTAEVAIGNPKQVIAGIVRELERSGYKREDITPAMIEGLLSAMADPGQKNRVIEGAIISKDN